ncbi:MAG: hypothetical protein K0S23_1989 [Fluviicola sp.]|nr:hypothetical protein [Fluviicola sp.]
MASTFHRKVKSRWCLHLRDFSFYATAYKAMKDQFYPDIFVYLIYEKKSINMKLFISCILLVFLSSCSDKKEVITVKSLFDIPENVSEESLINFGFKKEIIEEKEYVDLFGEKGHQVYENRIKNHSSYFYKKPNLSSEIHFIQGTISVIRISMDTIVWNELDKKLSQRIEIDTVYINKQRRVFLTRPHYAEIAGYRYKCKLPLKREDAWKQGSYYNPNTRKRIYNYSEYQFHTVSLEREFTRKHQNKLNRIMKGIKSRF